MSQGSVGPASVSRSRKPMWSPSASDREQSEQARFIRWLDAQGIARVKDYRDLWMWSVRDLEAFWASIWTFYGIKARAPYKQVLSSRVMPGAKWFDGAKLNFAEHLLQAPPHQLAVVETGESGSEPTHLTYGDLSRSVGSTQRALAQLGVRQGSVVVAYLPNGLPALITFLAVAGLGAVWSSCPPEFGLSAVLDRFEQLKPHVLIAAESYRYGGQIIDRSKEISELTARLKSLDATVIVHGPLERNLDGFLQWEATQAFPSAPSFLPVSFDHPLWVLYSSGTTGRPKGIIHGHGGILLESLKQVRLHMDLGPNDRFCWYTTTGWMMWNVLVSGLLSRGAIVLYDGSPSFPSLMALWRLVDEIALTYLGISAGLVHASMKARIKPADQCNLSSLRAIGSTGSPLSPEGFEWLASSVKAGIPIASMSGGTDVCTSFMSASRLLPVYAGELQCPALGVDAAAFDELGRPVVNQVGELVIQQPMPSMPIGFWNDPEQAKYRESYFSTYPGVWRHGDWIKFDSDGSAIISGRSDATLKRGGIRIGTAEFYRALAEFPQISDSLIVEIAENSYQSRLVLFVVLNPGYHLTPDLLNTIRTQIRESLSPRHVPDEILAAPEIPYTINGKKMEVPVKRILEGENVSHLVSTGSMANPESLRAFVKIRRRHQLRRRL